MYITNQSVIISCNAVKLNFVIDQALSSSWLNQILKLLTQIPYNLGVHLDCQSQHAGILTSYTRISNARVRSSTGDSSGRATKREACFRAPSFTSAPRPSSSSDGEPGEKTSSSVSAGAIRKKRAVDWPHEFAPGTSNSIDSDKIDLPQFVAGFLAMIKTYDIAKKCAMLDYLELLMLKASSYSWSSVRSFHSHIAKQIELWRLEWTSSSEIRDKAVTFFKHSDLRSSQYSSNVTPVSSSIQASSYQQRPPAKPEAEKSCRQWNYYGSCSCDKSNQDVFNARHKCRVCTKEHPMLHCPKRRNPIPPPQNSL